MLRLELPAAESWDEGRQEFVYDEPALLVLEHSLVAVSKWEARWEKIFLVATEKTEEEARDYVRCMAVGGDAPESAVRRLGAPEYVKINDYIGAPMTATRITRRGSRNGSGEQPSSELIYYWMISLGIPMECQHWHLNRLLTLIEVCNIKNAPPQKMNHREVLEQQAELNARRRKQMNSKG